MEAVSYLPTDAIIANPERGFYAAQEIFKVSSKGVSKDVAAANRKNYRTLYLLEFHLIDFVNTSISEEYLQTIRTYFQSMRDGGAKCILRFCYSNGMNESDKPWDADPALTLTHVAQVKPLIQEFADIIYVVQAGFIGSWGEWYYTDNYTDNATRKTLLEALLDAVPDSRQIELRTPAFKMNLYGYSLADTLTRATAHTTDVKARLAGHNDCFLASANDQGTYRGNNDRKYWAAESAYTIMGGETCATSAYCHCEKEGANPGTVAEMAKYHYSYLNQGYHQGVLSRWKSEGCFEQLQKRLAALSVNPDSIGLVYLTHFHVDHISGLVAKDETGNDTKAFKNAAVYAGKVEYDAWMNDIPKNDLQKNIMALYKDSLHLFAFGDTLPHGVRAIDAVGHTPGHTAFQLANLLIVGDLMHGYALQKDHPEINSNYDMDKPKSAESRKRIMQYARDNKLLMAGMHLPPPGFAE